MPSTTIPEATREEMLAEYVIRDAIFDVGNHILSLLEEDKDIYARIPGEPYETLVHDERYNELFKLLYPGDEDAPDKATNAESSYITARILRTIVYHADHLRGEADDLFRTAKRFELEASVDA